MPCRGTKRAANVAGGAAGLGAPRLPGDLERAAQSVETGGVAADRGVSLCAHGLDDARDRAGDRTIAVPPRRQQPFDLARIPCIDDLDRHRILLAELKF